MLERVVKYYEDKIREREASSDKLRLKNTTLKQQIAKLESLSSKKTDEVGDVLHYIDFHQLQIENAQYLAKIEEKNHELLRLKLTTGNTVATLNTLKGKLGGLTKEMSRLKSEIRARSQLLEKLRVDAADIDEIVHKAEVVHEGLMATARDAARMPKVIDYVELVRAQQELAREVKSWERKVEIASLAAKQRRHASTSLMSGDLATEGGAAAAATGTAAHSSAQAGVASRQSGSVWTAGTSRQSGDAFGRTIDSSFFKSTFPSAANVSHSAASSVGATLTGALARTAHTAGGEQLRQAATLASTAYVPGVSGTRPQGTWAGGAVPSDKHAPIPKGVGGFTGAAVRQGQRYGGVLHLHKPSAALSGKK
jgi:hypothetical protein